MIYLGLCGSGVSLSLLMTFCWDELVQSFRRTHSYTSYNPTEAEIFAQCLYANSNTLGALIGYLSSTILLEFLSYE